MSAEKEALDSELRRQFTESIYYLKVSELQEACGVLGLPASGAKGALIERVLNHVGIESESSRAISAGREARFPKYRGPLSPSSHILPGYFTNGSTTRARMKQLVGSHFSFTNYGMEWIREQWLSQRYPTFRQYADYWQTEYERRQNGGAFESLPTNARVLFFRDQKGSGMSKNELDAAWKTERERHVTTARRILGSVTNLGDA